MRGTTKRKGRYRHTMRLWIVTRTLIDELEMSRSTCLLCVTKEGRKGKNGPKVQYNTQGDDESQNKVERGIPHCLVMLSGNTYPGVHPSTG